MIKGHDLIIYAGVPAVAIAAAKSCTIVNRADVMESSSPSSGTARTFEPHRTSWEVVVSTLVLGVSDIILKARNVYTLSWKERKDTFYVALSGTAICTEAQIVASEGNLAQGSLRFQGSGEIVPWTPIGDYNLDYNNDYLNS